MTCGRRGGMDRVAREESVHFRPYQDLDSDDDHMHLSGVKVTSCN